MVSRDVYFLPIRFVDPNPPKDPWDEILERWQRILDRAAHESLQRALREIFDSRVLVADLV